MKKNFRRFFFGLKHCYSFNMYSELTRNGLLYLWRNEAGLWHGIFPPSCFKYHWQECRNFYWKRWTEYELYKYKFTFCLFIRENHRTFWNKFKPSYLINSPEIRWKLHKLIAKYDSVIAKATLSFWKNNHKCCVSPNSNFTQLENVSVGLGHSFKCRIVKYRLAERCFAKWVFCSNVWTPNSWNFSRPKTI